VQPKESRKSVETRSRRGSAEDYARIFGGSGRTGTTASMNCAVVAYRSSMQRSPLVRRPASDACPDIRRSNRPCATTISTHSVSSDSMSLSQLNPVEPPWYATRMPGGVGGVASRGVPLSRSNVRGGRKSAGCSPRPRKGLKLAGSCRKARLHSSRCSRFQSQSHPKYSRAAPRRRVC
jgi:hypothetical protein